MQTGELSLEGDGFTPSPNPPVCCACGKPFDGEGWEPIARDRP